MALRPEPYEGYDSDRVFDALEALEREAAERGVSMAALALAWALHQPELTAIVSGPGRASHLAPALEALDIELSPAERDHLTEVFS
jgi:aryl-alcohol dehydrogenase (NADP+)